MDQVGRANAGGPVEGDSHGGAVAPDAERRAGVEAINATTRYALWSVYRRTGREIQDPGAARAELDSWAAALAADGIVLRGAYDVSALRASADMMLWLHGPTAEGLQAAARRFRRTCAGEVTEPVWTAMGTHRPAEFSRDHVPSFMLGSQPLAWLCVYPFVRSYEWYLLPPDQRAEMLREHGLAGRAFSGVQANTVAAFGLNDYEWILALESNNLHELVDLMRDLRATEARRHVRLEVPFYTGRRIDLGDAVEVMA
jgi:chlorite dismutase